eukprot:1948914-Pyramimonas_sp.AAC.1
MTQPPGLHRKRRCANASGCQSALGQLRVSDRKCTAVMTGRGALIKPWIFKEFLEGAAWRPSAEERVGVYLQLTHYMKEHFGVDDMGRRKMTWGAATRKVSGGVPAAHTLQHEGALWGGWHALGRRKVSGGVPAAHTLQHEGALILGRMTWGYNNSAS